MHKHNHTEYTTRSHNVIHMDIQEYTHIHTQPHYAPTCRFTQCVHMSCTYITDPHSHMHTLTQRICSHSSTRGKDLRSCNPMEPTDSCTAWCPADELLCGRVLLIFLIHAL